MQRKIKKLDHCAEPSATTCGADTVHGAYLPLWINLARHKLLSSVNPSRSLKPAHSNIRLKGAGFL